jgi:hypothetical protein
MFFPLGGTYQTDTPAVVKGVVRMSSAKRPDLRQLRAVHQMLNFNTINNKPEDYLGKKTWNVINKNWYTNYSHARLFKQEKIDLNVCN